MTKELSPTAAWTELPLSASGRLRQPDKLADKEPQISNSISNKQQKPGSTSAAPQHPQADRPGVGAGSGGVPRNHPNVRKCRDCGWPRCRKKRSVGSCNEAAKLALAVVVKCFFKSFRDQLVHSKLNPAPFFPFTRLTERQRSMDPSLDFHGLHFEHWLISTSESKWVL